MTPVDELYRERARLLALLTRYLPAVLSYEDQDEPDWPVLFLQTSAGQLSWHIAPGDLDLFDSVPVVRGSAPRLWDGHSTEQKNERLESLILGG